MARRKNTANGWNSANALRSRLNLYLKWALRPDRLTFAQYLPYLRNLGFFIIYERLPQRELDRKSFGKLEHRLGHYA